MIEVFLGIVFGVMAIALVGVGMWLMEGWMDTRSLGLILILAIFAIVFVGAGFFALLGLGALIVMLFGAIGSS